MPMNAVLIIDKPRGMTSHDVVARVRRICAEKSVGHLGTLDPMATGVLPMVVGKMTRLAQFFADAEKEYEGTIRFGFATDTYDAEGEPAHPQQKFELDLEALQRTAERLRGEQLQTPPPFSAKKVNGVPAYKLARKNHPVDLKPVAVQVFAFEVTGLHDAVAAFRCRVSAGTYVRSLAHDLGTMVGCGAHLASLRRTRAGAFHISDARTLEALASSLELPDAQLPGIHPRAILPQMPSVTADEASLARIRHGNSVNLPEMSRAKLIKVFRGQTELVAIASRVAGTLFQPKIVL